jgi:Secretion system C-terminal sorting domain
LKKNIFDSCKVRKLIENMYIMNNVKFYPAILTIILLQSILFICPTFAQRYVAQPYYAENKIRFYDKIAPSPSSPYFVLDIAADVFTVWGDSIPGINDVVIYNSKIFVSYATDTTGGVLIYNFSDVYPIRTSTPPVVVKPGTGSAGLPTCGIAINPANGDLYIPTFYTGGSIDAGVFYSTAASGYTTQTQFSSYFLDNSVGNYCANLAFDTSGNLWMTTFIGDTASGDNFLICYKGLSRTNYYKIVNPTSKTYMATSCGGVNINVFLLSAPEGIAFDPQGNLWLANNNDTESYDNANFAGQGTLVKFNKNWMDTLLSSPSTGTGIGSPTYTPPTTAVSIGYIPGGKLGGLMFDHDTLYINDQGQDQGTSYLSNGIVWKLNTSGTFDSTNLRASGIHTTYPGNGGMSLTNAEFALKANILTAAPVTLVVAPNPAKASIRYSIQSDIDDIYEVLLVDAMGNVVFNSRVAANHEETVDIKNLSRGIYTLQAKSSGQGHTASQKIEIN